MKTLGLRHAALNVKDAQASKKFYTNFFGMTVEWEPDPANVYLTSGGQDNLALHENKNICVDPDNQVLDHLGFIMASKNSVDELYEEALRKKIPIFREVKQHRDGAYSFYLKDPDGIIVQVIYHPPIIQGHP